MRAIRHILGLCAAAALALVFYLAFEHYSRFANLSRLTGIDALRPVNAWLFEFRMPLLAVVGFLLLTLIAKLWQALKLGH